MYENERLKHRLLGKRFGFIDEQQILKFLQDSQVLTVFNRRLRDKHLLQSDSIRRFCSKRNEVNKIYIL